MASKNKIGAFRSKTKAPIFSVATLYKLIYILNQIKPISQVHFKNHLIHYASALLRRMLRPTNVFYAEEKRQQQKTFTERS